MHKSIMIKKGLYTGNFFLGKSNFQIHWNSDLYILSPHYKEFDSIGTSYFDSRTFGYRYVQIQALRQVWPDECRDIYLYIYLQPDEMKLSLQIKKTPNFLNQKIILNVSLWARFKASNSWCLHVIAPCCLIELLDKMSINAGVLENGLIIERDMH